MYLPPWSFNVKKINCFDIDGVIYFNESCPGVYPGPEDILITGRSFEEREKTEKWCKSFGIKNRIIFSMVPIHLRTREISGYHKAITLKKLLKETQIEMFFEDDPIQKAIIEAMVPSVKVVHLVHELTQK